LGGGCRENQGGSENYVKNMIETKAKWAYFDNDVIRSEGSHMK